MQIGILGTGGVGQTLARGLAGVGHAVTLGSRDPGAKDLPDFRVAGSAETVRTADVVISAVTDEPETRA